MKTTLRFDELSGPKIHLGLLKDWKKLKPHTLLIKCDHKESINDWDCGCSWGCASCDLNFRCSDCGGLFKGKNIPSVVIKEDQ